MLLIFPDVVSFTIASISRFRVPSIPRLDASSRVLLISVDIAVPPATS
jgi:hypothetical protein